MHAVELNAKILNSRIFFLEGEDLYWLDYAYRFFSGLVPDENKSVDIKCFGKLDSLSEVVAALSSFCFGGIQVIFVKDDSYKAGKKELALLTEIIKGGIEPYILVFDNVKFLTAAEKKLTVNIDCGKLERGILAKYTEKLFPCGIDYAAVNKLIEFTQSDMARISTEAEKLTAYADGKKVSADMVSELVTEDIEMQIFHFVNSVSSSDNVRAAKQLSLLLKRGESKQFILASLIKQYRRMLHCAISNLPDAELAAHLGVKEYAIKKCREIRITDKVAFKRKLDMLTDYEFKTRKGEMSESLAFDSALSRLMEK